MSDLSLPLGLRPSCTCGESLDRFWRYCPRCGRAQTWPDEPPVTGAECKRCGWAVSPSHRFCPWCRAGIDRAGGSRTAPLESGPGFRSEAPCDWGCGGGVQYPMPWCPWCGRDQGWSDDRFEGNCPLCARGVDDWMDCCPWCGGDSTGNALIRPALQRVEELLAASRIRPWGYRVLLRPGVSGVDPAYPDIVEIDKGYAAGKAPRRIDWPMLVGLIVHELGHSFLYRHLHWGRTERFRRAFGDVDTPYHVPDDVRVEFHQRGVSRVPVDHVTPYAGLHPQEDFAETFRLYVTRGARLDDLFAELEAKRKAKEVKERFQVLHDYVQTLADRDGG